MRLPSTVLAHNNVFGELSAVSWVVHDKWKQMLMPHHGNGFAGKRKVWHWPGTKYGVHRRKEKVDVRDDSMLLLRD